MIRHRDWSLLLSVMFLLTLTGCPANKVQRQPESVRFKESIGQRLAGMNLNPAEPLTMARCVEIALGNNLDYRVQQLRLALQDERVRLSLAGGLPHGEASYAENYRSNAALMEQGGAAVKTEDQTGRAFSIRAVIPVLDWGATYFAHQIAKDRRRQEQLLVERTRQTLVRDVRAAYARLAAMQRQERLVRVGLIAARELLRVAQSVEREGLAARADTAIVEAGVAQAAEYWASYRRQIEQARLALAQTMSLPAGTAFSIRDTVEDACELPTAADIRRFEDSALALRPELSVQDKERQIAANTVREQFARMLPRADGLSTFDWSSSSLMVNPSFFRAGAQVASSLLDGGSQWWRWQEARKSVPVEQERTLLLSLGILYQVDMNVLQLFTARDSISARQAVVAARQEALKQVVSKYLEGLETGTDAVRALYDMYWARVQLDAAQTDYQIAAYELEANTLAELKPGTGTPPEVSPLPSFEPAATLDNLTRILDSVPPADLRQYPELEGLLKAARGNRP